MIIWLPFQLLFNAQIAVKYSNPAMSLVLAVDIYLLFFYFLKKKSSKNKLNNESFLFMVPMIVILLSYLLSSVFGIIQATSGIMTMVKYFVSGFGMVFLAQKVLNSQVDLKLFIRCSVVVGILISLLGLSESILKDNLWLDFVYFNSPNDETTAGRMFYLPPSVGGGLEIRYGMVRARSFFGIHITYGFACLMYFWLLLIVIRNHWKYLSTKILSLTSILLLAGVFMANAKTGYVGLVILMLGLYPLAKIFNIKIIFPILLGIIVIMVCFPQYLNNFYSLFDSSLAEEGGGSTVSGREIQFMAAINMFEMNPIFGNGPGAISILRNFGNNGDILGAESSWMQILPERGLFGAFTYVFMYLYIFIKVKKIIPIKVILTFLLSLFVMETATGILDMSVWGVVLIVVNRMYQLYKVNNTSVCKQF